MKTELKRPRWIKVPASNSQGFAETLDVVRKSGVHTVCEEAMCPNIGECWKHRTATFLIMGDICTRNCEFCNIRNGKPEELDANESKKVAKSIKELGIEYAVITCVTRDDLKDGGAQHFANVINSIRTTNPRTKIEVLTSDFRGNVDSIRIVIDATPDVFGHNLEVVKRLHKKIKRPPADYDVSLNLLKKIKEINPKMLTKTGIMVGVGETKEEVFDLINEVAKYRVDILTIGQYLPPTVLHCMVDRYVTPEEFGEYAAHGATLGLKVVAAPLVRSSYKARECYNSLCHSE